MNHLAQKKAENFYQSANSQLYDIADRLTYNHAKRTSSQRLAAVADLTRVGRRDASIDIVDELYTDPRQRGFAFLTANLNEKVLEATGACQVNGEWHDAAYLLALLERHREAQFVIDPNDTTARGLAWRAMIFAMSDPEASLKVLEKNEEKLDGGRPIILAEIATSFMRKGDHAEGEKYLKEYSQHASRDSAAQLMARLDAFAPPELQLLECAQEQIWRNEEGGRVTQRLRGMVAVAYANRGDFNAALLGASSMFRPSERISALSGIKKSVKKQLIEGNGPIVHRAFDLDVKGY